ncbi:unnamed protein product [Sphenostylis stenocarpa]|uniref:Uncharacterized protein n=1 Tax=Sphenostylis stenocarpa TaxID=92480 RepID=A0AA86V9A8_9FABA|nr:unnamed protein product [Sphenostylis stenocarpa]
MADTTLEGVGHGNLAKFDAIICRPLLQQKTEMWKTQVMDHAVSWSCWGRVRAMLRRGRWDGKTRNEYGPTHFLISIVV